MSEMVERVARAMHHKRANSRITNWEDCSDEYRTGTMRDAHSAIASMREPTEGMVALAVTMPPISEDREEGDFAMRRRAARKRLWNAMIDEALK